MAKSDSAPFRFVIRSPAASQAQANDAWLQLYDGSGVGPKPYFNRPCCMPDGNIITFWNGPADRAMSGVWIFNTTTRTWSAVPEAQVNFPAGWGLGADGRRKLQWENTFTDWDESTSSVFSSQPAPTVWSDTSSGDFRFTPASNTFVRVQNGLAGADQMGGLWNGKAHMFGLMSGTFNPLKRRTIPNGTIETYVDTIVPPYGTSGNDLSGAKMGVVRGGVDHRVGMAWLFNNDNELYMRDLSGGPGDGKGWIHYPAGGTKPERGFTATLIEHLDCIVAYTGDGTGQTGDPFPTDARTTYVLDLATLRWRFGPRLPAAVPPGIPQAAANLLYDRFNRKVYQVQVGPTAYAVWRFDREDTLL